MRVRPSPRILIACLAVWSAAVAAKPRFHFDLAPAPLTTSVARIGALAGVSIATSDPALLNGSGRAIRLNGTAEAALKALLKGTQARAVPIGSNGWRIVARVRTVERPIANKPETSPAPEIVVLGSKRDRPLADYPASITMIDCAELVRFGSAPDTNALARIDPTIQSTHLGPGRDKLFLRGIADSSFNGSGAALVGIYVNDLRLTYNAPDPALRFYDADRIEILEGPQGTLYGAGSMAGLVRITPHAPELNAASGEAWIGGTLTAYGSPGGDVGGIANIPLVRDRVALRVVGYAARDGGYIDDAMRGRDVNRTNTVGGRATLRAAVGDEWTLDVGGIVQDIRNRDAQYAERDQPILTRASIAAQPSSNLLRAGDIVLTGSIGSVNVTSTTGWSISR
jgi:iron complex outermembrane receptor protein